MSEVDDLIDRLPAEVVARGRATRDLSGVRGFARCVCGEHETRARYGDQPAWWVCWLRHQVTSTGQTTEIANVLRLAAVLDPPAALSADQARAVIAAWHDATGGLGIFEGFPGLLGTRAYRWLVARGGLEARGIPTLADAPDETLIQAWSGRLSLRIDHLFARVRPQLGQTLTEIDIRGQYLPAAGIDLPVGDPERITAPRDLAGFARYPGYVELAHVDLASCTVANQEVLADRVAPGAVITMPWVKALTKLGAELRAAEVLYWPRTRPGVGGPGIRRHLESWYELFRDARTILSARADPAAAIALRILKLVYTVFLGGWMRSPKNPDETRRLDCADMIMTSAFLRMFLALDKAARAGAITPLAIRADSIWYVADGPYQPPGLEFSDQLGKWRTTFTTPVTPELVGAHARGVEILAQHLASLKRTVR